jgi:radical SAM superfamily enzyme YgiQ (UPF0313 family)
MRIVLADLTSADGFVSKDTVVGGYGSRLRPFSRTTRLVCEMKRRLHDLPSVQLGYLAAILTEAGHEVVYTEGRHVDGDVTIVLTSLVDYRHEAVWGAAQRECGSRVGFIGLTASKLPELFDSAGDFVIIGEPESAVFELARGKTLSGRVQSPAIEDLSSLPFPRWDIVRGLERQWWSLPLAGRPTGGAYPLLASRGCPEFCTYCPHRILASHRERTPASIADEVEHLTTIQPEPYVVFRDPLFTNDRDRCLALCDEIRARGLSIRFECETRLDRLDPELIDAMHKAGLSAISFGVETVSVETLKRAGRRPIPPEQQQAVMADCRSRGIVTAAFYVFGFLQDTWSSIVATIDYANDLGSTVAQFKLLTPYPGTPMWRQLAPLVYEKDWERFDGYTPTFTHPSLSAAELRFLLGAAYTRFYMRPSCLANYFRVQNRGRRFVSRCDRMVRSMHERAERASMAKGLTC